MMPRRILRGLHDPDPERRHRFQLAAIIAMALFAATIWWLTSAVLTGKDEIRQRPTRGEVLDALAAVRKDQRRACRVVNQRFAALGNLLANQRPSAARTAYFRDHPDELAQAQANFDATLRALRPRNCLKAYPIPKPGKISTPARTRPKTRAASPQGLRSPPVASAPVREPANAPVRKRRRPSSSPTAPGSQPQAPAQEPVATLNPPGEPPPGPANPPRGPLGPVCDLLPQLPPC